MLLYHRIGFPKPSSKVAGQYVAPLLFKSELDSLSRRGWKQHSLEEITASLDNSSKRYALTFDDGYLSVYDRAYPILLERGMTATIYVVVNTIGGINEWDYKNGDNKEMMMNVRQVKEMADAGFEIGSHTLTHPHLTAINEDQLAREITDSKHKLEDIIGKEVTSFSYPYGDYDKRVASAAQAAGYKNAVTTRLGAVSCGSLFEIPRVNVRWSAIGPLLMRKINRAIKTSEVGI